MFLLKPKTRYQFYDIFQIHAQKPQKNVEFKIHFLSKLACFARKQLKTFATPNPNHSHHSHCWRTPAPPA